jgi:hypothetical protein
VLHEVGKLGLGGRCQCSEVVRDLGARDAVGGLAQPDGDRAGEVAGVVRAWRSVSAVRSITVQIVVTP